MIHVRAATAADAEFLAAGNAAMALETEGITLDPAILSRGVRAVLADSAKGRYFIAEQDGRAAGMMMVTWEYSDWRAGPFWWVQSVYVLPAFRRAGVFQALYQHVRQLAKEAGGAGEGGVGLRLYVEENNRVAQATYKKLGMGMTHYRVMEELLRREVGK